MRGIFITGCATGFGAGLARHYLHAGWHVTATDRDVGALAPLRGLPGADDRLVCLALDVTDTDSVLGAVDTAVARGPVDVVVNNAGYALFGTLEEADLTAVAHLFDVNVMGVARVTQALLPHLRQRGGCVVNLSSVAGRMSFPESGYYAATKHAVEAMSEALFIETSAFGVRVVVIEPGSFDTQFLATALERSLPRDPNGPYVALQPRWDAVKQRVLEPLQPPGLVVQAIADAVERDLAFQRVAVGPDSERILKAVDALGRSGFVRLLSHESSESPAWEQPGDCEDVSATMRELSHLHLPE